MSGKAWKSGKRNKRRRELEVNLEPHLKRKGGTYEPNIVQNTEKETLYCYDEAKEIYSHAETCEKCRSKNNDS